MLLVGALVAVAVLMAALAGPWQLGHRAMSGGAGPELTLPPQNQAPQPSASATAGAGVSVTQGRQILLVLLVVLGLVAVLILAFLLRRLARKLRERRAGRDVDAADPDIGLEDGVADVASSAMRAGAKRAAQVLEREVPPGDAVIAAWVTLESSAEKSGIHRDRAQTATEFTLDVLESTPADARAARELLDLYLAARYSEHRLTQTDVDRARASLATIAQGLES